MSVTAPVVAGTSWRLHIDQFPFDQRPAGEVSSAPVPCFQHEFEFEALLELYRARRPKRVLEIGTYHGGTLWHWLQSAPAGAQIVSVDSYAVGVDNRQLYPEWYDQTMVTCVALQGDSHAEETIASVAELGPYDWLFIDAGHTYGEVLADWNAYAPLVRGGGVIALHDLLPCPPHVIEVGRLWREIQRQGYLTQEIVCDPGGTYGIGVVYV